MRRMNGRYPNIALIGLLFVIVLIGYKCWTLSSQNDDLRKEMEKLQTELKISGMQQEKFEKTNQVLQGNIHDLNEKQEKLNLQVVKEDQALHDAQNSLKMKENEIEKLKNNLMKKEEDEKDLLQQIEEKEGKIEELVSDSQHILTLKNDAEDALSEKDNHINYLKREVEKLKKELENVKKESISGKSSKPRPPTPILHNDENKDPSLVYGSLGPVPKRSVRTRNVGLQGMKFHPGLSILPRQPSNVKRAKPRFSVGDLVKGNLPLPGQADKPKIISPSYSKNDVIHENNVIPSPNVEQPHNPDEGEGLDQHQNGVLEKPNKQPAAHPISGLSAPGNPVLQEPHLQEESEHIPNDNRMVLQPPHNPDENLDTAIDDEAKAVDDPADDQDEEGKEIKRDLENNAVENYENYDDEKVDNIHVRDDSNADETRQEPRGIGAARRDNSRKEPEDNLDDVNLVDDVDQRANERLYEANFDNNIRNLGKL